MKKISISIVLGLIACLSFAQTNYYVDVDGDDANTGSLEAPFATIARAIDTVNAVFDTLSTSCTINIGEGTFEVLNIKLVNGGKPDSLFLVGMGANKTILTADATTDTVPGAGLFDDFSDVNNNLFLSLKQLKVYNYGYKQVLNKSSLFRLYQGNITGMSITVDQCFIEKIENCDAAIIKTPLTSLNNVTFTNNNFSNITTTYFNNQLTCPIDFGGGSIVFENNMFDGFIKDFTGQPTNLQKKSSWGVFLTCNSKNNVLMDARIVNNTFINAKLVNPENQQCNQYAITLRKHNASSVFNLVLSNNIIINEVPDFIGKASDGVADATLTFKTIFEMKPNDMTSVVYSNNVLQKDSLQSTMLINADMNTKNINYNHTSVEIGFNLDDVNAFVYDTTLYGIPYVKVDGEAVVGKADATVQTEYDITGTLRSTTAYIGAYEGEFVESSFEGNDLNSKIILYPNPVTGGVLKIAYSDISQSSAATVCIYDINGKEVLSHSNSPQSINVSHLENGFYIVEVESGNSKMIRKIIIN